MPGKERPKEKKKLREEGITAAPEHIMQMRLPVRSLGVKKIEYFKFNWIQIW